MLPHQVNFSFRYNKRTLTSIQLRTLYAAHTLRTQNIPHLILYCTATDSWRRSLFGELKDFSGFMLFHNTLHPIPLKGSGNNIPEYLTHLQIKVKIVLLSKVHFLTAYIF